MFQGSDIDIVITPTDHTQKSGGLNRSTSTIDIHVVLRQYFNITTV